MTVKREVMHTYALVNARTVQHGPVIAFAPIAGRQKGF